MTSSATTSRAIRCTNATLVSVLQIHSASRAEVIGTNLRYASLTWQLLACNLVEGRSSELGGH